MGMMQRIASLFTKAQTTSDKYVQSSIRFLEGSGTHGEKPWPFNYHLAMTQVQSWVYRCGMGNAQAAAAVHLRLYVRAARDRHTKQAHDPLTGRRLAFATRPVSAHQKRHLLVNSAPSVRTKLMTFGDDFEEVVESHPVTDVLRKSNPWMNGYEMSVYRFAALEFTGNAYWHPVMGPMDNPLEIYPLPPQWVHIVPGKEHGQLVSAYTYGQTRKEEQVFEPDEVLHFKYPNPRDLMYGMGKIEAAWTALGLHASERTMHKALFDNHARPDWILMAKDGTTPEQLDRLEAKVEGKLKGVQNAGRFLTFAGAMDAKPLSWSPKDIGTDENIIEEIAGVFGYPITKLKGNDPNRANAETGDAGWMKDTILPILRMDEEALNQSYLPLFQSGALMDDAVLAYDDPVPANRKQELAESKTLVAAGIRTINEDRALRGDEPLPEGDVLRVNGTALATLDNPAQPADPLAGIFGALSAPKPEPTQAVDPVAIANTAAAKAVECAMKEQRRMMRKMLAMVEKRLQGKEPTDGDNGTGQDTSDTAVVSDKETTGGESGGAVTPPAGLSGTTKRAGGDGACHCDDERDATGQHDVQEDRPVSESDTATIARDAATKAIDMVFNQLMERLPKREDWHGGYIFRDEESACKFFDYMAAAKAAKETTNGNKSAPATTPTRNTKASADPNATPAKNTSADSECSHQVAVSHKNLALGLATCNHNHSDDAAFMPEHFKGWHTKADEPREDEDDSPVRRMARALAGILADMRKDVLSLLQSTTPGKAKPKNISAIRKDLSPDDYERIERQLRGYDAAIREALRPVLEQVFRTGGMAGVTRLFEMAGKELPGVSFDLTNPAVSAKLEGYTERLAGGITETTVTRLRSSLSQGVEKGENIGQLTQRVEQTGLFDPNRAEAIARSESARAYVDGQLEAWKQSGVVQGKKWLLAPQACTFCDAASKEFNDKTVGLDEPFFKQGSTLKGTDGSVMQLDYSDVMGPPLHPQCRCDVTAALAEIE